MSRALVWRDAKDNWFIADVGPVSLEVYRARGSIPLSLVASSADWVWTANVGGQKEEVERNHAATSDDAKTAAEDWLIAFSSRLTSALLESMGNATERG